VSELSIKIHVEIRCKNKNSGSILVLRLLPPLKLVAMI